jgi:hypothetical protein
MGKYIKVLISLYSTLTVSKFCVSLEFILRMGYLGPEKLEGFICDIYPYLSINISTES